MKKLREFFEWFYDDMNFIWVLLTLFWLIFIIQLGKELF